ncbi:hypothetical protein MSG28_014427 [Choristoneura fumiferana]|uniref:Uncharacterized protein n=1 Tax=Choristoneura fumiferana TaxID=7141 RepID=A0ACC0JRD4_CHOFU|nr:hypothetical protein MSG28_014427 [Choristoneura fumiferana]
MRCRAPPTTHQCLEYQMRVIYPCEESKTLMGDKVRRDYCRHNAGELIAGGTDAKLDEFPHMVLLGYGSNISSADWNFCAGTLISDRFILTAATCTATRLNDDAARNKTGGNGSEQ